MSSLPHPFVTPEEYLETELKAEFRSEYLDGKVYAMAGASPSHMRLSVNLLRRVDEALEGGSCEVFPSDAKVRVAMAGPYFYPDLVVVCGEPQWQGRGVLLNPKVVIEILSPSTEAFDRGRKFQEYRRQESLAEYVLISQDRPQIEVYLKQPNGEWSLTSCVDPDGVVELAAIGVRLKMAEIYSQVKFES
jgi:Uma2 family endonuclease